ncbi:MAG TPA: T9SS type A sorting domain-containing protein [Flavobacteriales bacterium]|nr:T9SS type A sorting domain-containing protein [Flavobacteriales bacterium]
MEHWVQGPFDPLPGYAHVYGTDVVEDTLGWTVISGSFLADSAYRYVVVGNFFSDEETNWSLMDPNGTGYLAYYYIDEVCVSRDPLYCAQQAGIDGAASDLFRVWSDPSAGSLHVAGLQGSGVLNLWVVDAVGRLVVPQQAVGATDVWSINTSTWASGVYIVAAERSNGSRRAERVFLGR